MSRGNKLVRRVQQRLKKALKTNDVSYAWLLHMLRNEVAHMDGDPEKLLEQLALERYLP